MAGSIVIGGGGGGGGAIAADAPADGQFYTRQNGAWIVTPACNYSRYIRQRFCDAPLNPTDVQLGAGGAAIGTATYPTLYPAGHQGVWKFGTGGTAASYCCLISSAIGAEFMLTNMNKLAFRLVFGTFSAIPSGAVGATTYAEILLGWFSATHLLPLPTQKVICWRFALNTSPNWILSLADGTAENDVISNVPVAINTWYDARIYWDASGVIGKIGPYGGTLFSTGKVTTNVPATSSAMFWQIALMSGAAGTTPYSLYTSLYEIIAEQTGSPVALGDTLITNF
jgi:hypothetical protein